MWKGTCYSRALPPICSQGIRHNFLTEDCQPMELVREFVAIGDNGSWWSETWRIPCGLKSHYEIIGILWLTTDKKKTMFEFRRVSMTYHGYLIPGPGVVWYLTIFAVKDYYYMYQNDCRSYWNLVQVCVDKYTTRSAWVNGRTHANQIYRSSGSLFRSNVSWIMCIALIALTFSSPSYVLLKYSFSSLKNSKQSVHARCASLLDVLRTLDTAPWTPAHWWDRLELYVDKMASKSMLWD